MKTTVFVVLFDISCFIVQNELMLGEDSLMTVIELTIERKGDVYSASSAGLN